MKLMILTVLAMLPFKAIAFAAESKLITLTGEEAGKNLDQQRLQQKNKLFEPYKTLTDRESAFLRFKALSRLDNDQAKLEFDKLILQMAQEGLIQMNEKYIFSGTPSGTGDSPKEP